MAKHDWNIKLRANAGVVTATASKTGSWRTQFGSERFGGHDPDPRTHFGFAQSQKAKIFRIFFSVFKSIPMVTGVEKTRVFRVFLDISPQRVKLVAPLGQAENQLHTVLFQLWPGTWEKSQNGHFCQVIFEQNDRRVRPNRVSKPRFHVDFGIFDTRARIESHYEQPADRAKRSKKSTFSHWTK